MLRYDASAAWRRLRTPATYLRAVRAADLDLLRSINPLVTTEEVTSGHWPQLQAPDAINQIIAQNLIRPQP
jgi:hypothetical protein